MLRNHLQDQQRTLPPTCQINNTLHDQRVQASILAHLIHHIPRDLQRLLLTAMRIHLGNNTISPSNPKPGMLMEVELTPTKPLPITVINSHQHTHPQHKRNGRPRRCISSGQQIRLPTTTRLVTRLARLSSPTLPITLHSGRIVERTRPRARHASTTTQATLPLSLIHI